MWTVLTIIAGGVLRVRTAHSAAKIPAARGFVRNSFYSGLRATEFFFHTMGYAAVCPLSVDQVPIRSCIVRVWDGWVA